MLFVYYNVRLIGIGALVEIRFTMKHACLLIEW